MSNRDLRLLGVGFLLGIFFVVGVLWSAAEPIIH